MNFKTNRYYRFLSSVSLSGYLFLFILNLFHHHPLSISYYPNPFIVSTDCCGHDHFSFKGHDSSNCLVAHYYTAIHQTFQDAEILAAGIDFTGVILISPAFEHSQASYNTSNHSRAPPKV